MDQLIEEYELAIKDMQKKLEESDILRLESQN